MADAHDQENSWAIAFVGNGVSKKDEYLIINRDTGMHLTIAVDYNKVDRRKRLSLELTQQQIYPCTGSS